jgi:serine/threonine protein kinase
VDYFTSLYQGLSCPSHLSSKALGTRLTKPSFESDVYSLAMVMIEFSMPSHSTPWEGEVANSSIIYDFVCRGE